MYGIELLVEEHKNILIFTDHIKKLCCGIIENKRLSTAEFRECIDFGRNYADKQHHGKEEKVLFRVMTESLGPVAEKLIRNGMLVEHDLGRYHIGELEEALNQYDISPTTEGKLEIISNASGYANLLRRHIDKEDSVVYTFAERSLSEQLKAQIDSETKEFEKKSEKEGIQEKYISMIQGWKE